MNILEKILGNPERVKTLRRAALALLAFLALLEIVAVKVLHWGHGHFWFEELPAFGSLYGLLSCVLIVLVSKALGHGWLMKDEDYYD